MNLINGKVARNRVQDFMQAEEMQQCPALPPATGQQPAVEVAGASFAWKHDAPPLLHDVNLTGGQAAIRVVLQPSAPVWFGLEM
jgi:ABC-type transport system involved in cytochrome bd biosynthesis fused ATPase/permease subunit